MKTSSTPSPTISPMEVTKLSTPPPEILPPPLALATSASGWYGGASDPLGDVDLFFPVLAGLGLVSGGAADTLLCLALLRLNLRFRLSRRLWALVMTHVGYTIVGLDGRADDRRAGGVSGVVLGVGVGLSISPGRSRAERAHDGEC